MKRAVEFLIAVAGVVACKQEAKSGAGGLESYVHRGRIEVTADDTVISPRRAALPPGHPPIDGPSKAHAMGDDVGEARLPPVVIDGRRGDVDDGRKLWAVACASCHGADGRGGGAIAAGNLADVAWQARATDQQIGVVISHGKPNTKMPGFASSMDLKKLNDLVAFIRTFVRGPPN